MKNVILQSLGLDLVNINVYAKVYQNIPLSSRDRTIFPFSEFGARQSLDNDKCHFAIFWTRCRQYQCVCKILSNCSKRFKNYRHFSQTGRWQNLHKLSGDKINCLIIGHTMKVNPQVSVDFLRVVQCLAVYDKPLLYIWRFNLRLGSRKTDLSPQYFNIDRSNAVLLLWFLTVTCSCCPYLYFGSAIMLETYFVNFR